MYKRAACKGTSYHFSQKHNEREKAREKREKTAKAICQTCPVLELCINYALEQRESGGIWGGMTEVERMTKFGLDAVAYADNAVKARIKKRKDRAEEELTTEEKKRAD